MKDRLATAPSLCRAQLLFLRRPVDSPVPGAPRAPILVQHHVGRDEERGRKVQLLHRGPAHPAPFLAGVHHQLSHVRDDRCVLDQPCTPRVADPWCRLGGYLPACGRRWEPYLIPDRTQSLVDDLLILIVLTSHRPPKKRGVSLFLTFLILFFAILTNEYGDALPASLTATDCTSKMKHLEFFFCFLSLRTLLDFDFPPLAQAVR
jgi:hypothetical protein